ncbi:MAG: hypothetical protein ACKOJ9_01590, partial [Actinomycetota bacterium]
MQFPADTHDTERKPVLGLVFWTPEANDAGCPSAHTPSVDVCVNASKPPAAFLNDPTAVQFPADTHDTDLKLALGLVFWTPVAKDAGRAVAHTPPVDVCVNASLRPAAFLKYPAAVQFPADTHDTEMKHALGLVFWT